MAERFRYFLTRGTPLQLPDGAKTVFQKLRLLFRRIATAVRKTFGARATANDTLRAIQESITVRV